MNITKADIEALYDKKAVNRSVNIALSVALNTEEGVAKFISRYANLNAWFGSGVASLAGKIGHSRGLFTDPSESVVDLADRSVLVASYFFDAARDEFDDRDTPHRDTHRCLAQACLMGILDYAHIDSNYANYLLTQPLWLQGIGSRVSVGYGVGTSQLGTDVFRAMGYHIGSEILADMEFSKIDKEFRMHRPVLVEHLEKNDFTVAGQPHNGYLWIKLHSGHGSSKEVDHFEWAMQGVNEAFKYTPEEDHATYKEALFAGFQSFVRDHQTFFNHVSES